MGERPEEAGGAGALIFPVAGEGVRRGRPLFDPGRGNREGDAGERWAGPGVGGGGPVWATGPVGGKGLLLFFSFSLSVLFSVFFLFAYFLFCFISFKSI